MNEQTKPNTGTLDSNVTMDGFKQNVTKTYYGWSGEWISGSDGKLGKPEFSMAETAKRLKGDKVKMPADIIEGHTFNIEFDYAGCTLAQVLELHRQTSTIYKLFYNKYITPVKEEDLQKTPDRLFKINVLKDLLTTSGGSKQSPEQIRDSYLTKIMKASGMTKQEAIDFMMLSLK